LERRLSQFFTQKTAEKCALVKADGKNDPLVTGLEYDSRKIKPGNLFFALPGTRTDGSIFIDEAVSKGASVVVLEKEARSKKDGVNYLLVKDSRFAMSPISAAFYNFPSRRMIVTGVTGTEGKSTTVYLIWQLLTLLGKKAGFFSTVQQCLGGEVFYNTEHQTTPEAPVVQRLLNEMADNGCQFAVVEASSHGLSRKTNRLGDVEFYCAVITNLTHEHLEFHGTWEQYRNDKANLFRALDNYAPPEGSLFDKPFGVINADDKNAAFFKGAAKQKTLTFSAAGGQANITLEAIESGSRGNWYLVSLPDSQARVTIRDRLPGSFNSGNVLAAILTAGELLKIPAAAIVPFINKLKPVRGRMNTVDKGQPFELVVDFAHTPSSFAAIYPPLRKRLDKTGGRIISVFGSAGERDVKKRFEQGKIAAAYSDIIVLTDEDPRGENPMDILEEIARGATEDTPAVETFYHDTTGRKAFSLDDNLFLIPNRPEAIRKALSLAREKDLVLLLGKGHENSIIYAGHEIPFDETEEAEKALAETGWH
jgi:UDP-N-acetylmuramoyl-L-alanyl-D-glutamate--2,6-diaminopimelate ligase